jgi:hypothetical protein
MASGFRDSFWSGKNSAKLADGAHIVELPIVEFGVQDQFRSLLGCSPTVFWPP